MMACLVSSVVAMRSPPLKVSYIERLLRKSRIQGALPCSHSHGPQADTVFLHRELSACDGCSLLVLHRARLGTWLRAQWVSGPTTPGGLVERTENESSARTMLRVLGSLPVRTKAPSCQSSILTGGAYTTLYLKLYSTEYEPQLSKSLVFYR